MGLFDAFKKKVEEKSEEVNPLYNAITSQNFGIDNVQVVNDLGKVTVTGSVENGAVLSKVTDFLSGQQGVNEVANNIVIADVSDQGHQYKVATKGSNLNVRAGGGTDFDILGRFAKDTSVLLVRRMDDTWFVMRGPGIDGNEVEGFCHTDYLEAISV